VKGRQLNDDMFVKTSKANAPPPLRENAIYVIYGQLDLQDVKRVRYVLLLFGVL
jgi:hypothetical protein